MRFSVKPKSQEIQLETGQGVVETLVLEEMFSGPREQYIDSARSNFERGPDGKFVGVKKFEGLQAELLSRCLFRKEGHKPVSRDEVQGWPGGMVAELFRLAKQLNQLDDAEKAEPETAAKNG